MTRPVPFPWPLALVLLPAIAFPVKVALTDLRIQELTRQAVRHQSLAQFDEALRLRREAALASPRDAQVQLALGVQARSLWFFRGTVRLQQEADSAFRRAGMLSPHWPVPHFEHARMYALKEQYVQALTLLEPALRLDPNNAGYWLERARYLESIGRINDARIAFQRCWATDAVRDCEAGTTRLEKQP